MADSVTTYAGGDPALASYALLLDGDGVEIASTGNYVQGTGIALTNPDYTDNILQVDDIDVGDLVTAEIGYVDIYDSADQKLIRFTLDPVLTLDHVEYTFVWPVGGIEFTSAPTVTTGVTTLITANSATCAGNVTDDGGGTISERGIAYGTSANPTIAGDHEAVAGTTGAFTADLEGLDNFTTYHYRAFATNEAGTSYGTDQTFVTGDIVSIVTPNRTASIIGVCARYNNATPYGLVDLRYNNSADKFFSWDNNQILWTKSQQQRCRQLRNSKWINTRYIWSVVTRTDGYTSNGIPTRQYLENEWTVTKSRTLEDMYVHTTVPEAEGNRAQWVGSITCDYIKFADPDMLDILFGAAGAEGAGSWILSNYPTLYNAGQIDPVDYYGHDLFASYGYLNNGYPEPPTGQESEYGYSTNKLIGHRWYEYLTAFRTRILDPLGRKLIVNMSQCRHNYVVGGLPTVDYVDTDFAELFDGMFYEAPLGKTDTWTGQYDYYWGLEEFLTFSRTLLDAGKAVASAYGENHIAGLRLYNKGTELVGARSFAVSSKYLKLEQQDDSILAIDLLAQTSLDALRTAINAQSDSFTAEVYGDSSGSAGATWFTDAIPNLREVAATDVAAGAWTTLYPSVTAPLSPKLQTAPREYVLMQMAYFLLLGVRYSDKLYVGLSQDAMSAGTPSHTDIHDLLPLLGEPDSRQTTWEKVNEAWGDVYYRLYENGVALFNWEAMETSNRTINASDFSQTKWYRISDNLYIPGESWQETNSLSLAPKSGEICIFSIG